MTTLISGSLKTLALCFIALVCLTLTQVEARADEVTISGSTTGTVTGVPLLTFSGNTFTGTTALGVGSLSGTNRLGTFTLGTSSTAIPASGTFTLNVTFTAPSGISGGQNTTYTATITGSISSTDNGGVLITFNQPSGGTVFTFSDGTTTGTFSMLLADVFVQSGRTANLTAGIAGSQTAIPEPATLILLGTGLTGIAARIRKRRKSAKAETIS